jgi:osmoprotectant transport system ATP-binding protein
MSATSQLVTADSPAVEFRSASYVLPNGQSLLNGINLSIRTGETLVLLGRSGAGKSTALKLINRMIGPSGGDVLVQGRPTRAWNPIELRRKIGYVIQETGLFPHFTVQQNVSLVPKLEKWPEDKIRARVCELMSLVGMNDPAFLDRYPHELSGGQRQRVGVARALAADPPILLMDEAFGALDPLTRGEVQREFSQLKQRLNKTMVIVTHNVDEAILLGTRIGVMDAGRLTNVYSPKEFLSASEPVAAAYVANLRMYAEAERSAEGKV